MNEYNELEDDLDKYQIVIKNLDKFLIQLYSFYNRKGLLCIFLEEITNLLLTFFLVSFIIYITSFINYDLLSKTYDLSYSTDINFYNINIFLKISFIFFTIIWIRQFVSMFYSLHDNYKIKKFYNEQLKINDDELKTINWSDITLKLIRLPYLSSDNLQLDPLKITNRIMRKENYLIGMINDGIFNFKFNIPLFNYEIDFFTKTMEWGIYLSVIDFMFDKNNRIKKDFLHHSNNNLLINTINYRFKLLAILGIILSPFILFFLFSYYVFKYGEDYRSHSNKVNTREWNHYAKWKFREFNELNIIFQERLNESYKSADNYIKQFHSYEMNLIYRFLYFIGSSLLIVLIVLTFVDDNYLTKLNITEGKTTLWYIGVIGSILAIIKNSIFDERDTFHPNTEMNKVIENTHYFPKHWRHNFHKMKIYKEFSKLYEYKLFLYFKELIGIITTPFILFFYASIYSEMILKFIQKHSVELDDVGYICSYATFDFQKYGNMDFGSSYDASEFKSKNGKMEKSFLNFKKQYPEWTINGGDELIENIYKYNNSIQLRNSDICNLTNSEKYVNKSKEHNDNTIENIENIENIFNIQESYYDNKLNNINIV